jgi:hypothetical protein
MIYIIWAPPRQGKTYLATRIGVQAMTGRHPRRVFSNYPIIDEKTGKSSYVWTPEKTYDNINGSIIIIDEAYRDYNSRNFKGFSTDDHTFFATNGHLGNDIYLIAQNPARIDTVIREMANEYLFVSKFHPFEFLGWRPFWFKIRVYLSYEEFKMMGRLQPYAMFRHIAWKRYADAYDTHYYKQEERGYHVTWREYLETEAINNIGNNVDMGVAGGGSFELGVDDGEKKIGAGELGRADISISSQGKRRFMPAVNERIRSIFNRISMRSRKINQENRK